MEQSLIGFEKEHIDRNTGAGSGDRFAGKRG